MQIAGTAAEFIHGVGYNDLPANVQDQAQRCLLDLIGVAAAGTATPLSRIARNYASGHATAPTAAAPLLFDGRRVAAPSAALANAATLDSMDGHDGHRLVKGHAGVAVLPAVLAFLDELREPTHHDLLTALVVGYEVALRGGITLHQSAADYHSSGAWNALGAAAVGARLLGLDHTATSHALGIAEYSAPRAPMMRAIDHPTMVKDSSAWGAQAGASAVLLAAAGFTGAPAELITTGDAWANLGSRWLILEQYFKPYPVCRWAHPAVQAVLTLMTESSFETDEVDFVEVTTFAAAARLSTSQPTTTEEAQYSLPFAVAAALVHGQLVPENVLQPRSNREVLRLAANVRLVPSPDMTSEFPAVRRAMVRIAMKDGRYLLSAPTIADGDPESPLSTSQLLDKFSHNRRSLRPDRRKALAEVLLTAEPTSVQPLMKLLTEPITSRPGGEQSRPRQTAQRSPSPSDDWSPRRAALVDTGCGIGDIRRVVEALTDLPVQESAMVRRPR